MAARTGNHNEAGPIPDPEAHERRIQGLAAHYAQLGAVGRGITLRIGKQPRSVACDCGCGGWANREAAAKALGTTAATVAKRIKGGLPIGGHRLRNGPRPARV